MHYGADASGCPIKCIPDLIRKRAYQLFEARGRRQGHELDDWLQAEREIKHHLGSPDGDKQFMRRDFLYENETARNEE